MPLILAIDADSHQATMLASLVRTRLSSELVQATSVGEGLLALGERVPDLILTSPLLSPFDDGVLDEYLRELGPAAAHVQTLRIPVFGQAPQAASRFGFSFLRRRKAAAAMTQGCDPGVFADEVAGYLSRATEARAQAQPAQGDTGVVAAHSTEAMTDPAGARAVPTPPTRATASQPVQPAATAEMAPPTEDSFEAALASIRAAWADTVTTASGAPPPPVTDQPGSASLIRDATSEEGAGDDHRLVASQDQVPTAERPGSQAQGSSRRPPRDADRQVEDEWGIFDAAQCGFAALVDRLGDVTEDKDEKPAETGTKVRVISHW